MTMEVENVGLPGILAGWEGMSAAERDAAYNNTAAVADVVALHAARAAASEVSRTRAGAVLDIPYGPGPRNRLDLFPGAEPFAPCLVFFHGGYWQMNSKESFACLGDGVFAHGWSVAIAGYTLAPDATLTRIVEETGEALTAIARHGPAFGIAGPLVVAGWSAGGHLAAMALEHPDVVAGLAVSGVFELAPLRDTYLNERLRLSSAEIASLSPLRRPVVPKPFVLAYGAEELPALIHNSHVFHRHRARTGAPGECVRLDGHNHFTILSELRSPEGILTQALLRMVAPTSGRTVDRAG